MRAIVLAAGRGARLGDLTATIPKTLLEVDGARTILDICLDNLAACGTHETLIVTGHAAERIDDLLPALRDRTGMHISTIYNDRGASWNNAYSLWVAREWLDGPTLVVNSDTVHPPSVERGLLERAAPGDVDDHILLALDDVKALAQEEMKVEVDAAGRVTTIHKALDPATVAGEYIGISWIGPGAGAPLITALEATWSEDPGRYYEDAYQRFADVGGAVTTVAVGAARWTEVDDAADLARAREIACTY